MNRKITVNFAEIHNNQLNLNINEAITDLVPSGQILVDSDHFSFIYLMENKDDYTYIELPETIWPVLKEALDGKLPAWLIFKGGQLKLTLFQEELDYVTNNIKGNGNYSLKMVRKVEEIFF